MSKQDFGSGPGTETVYNGPPVAGSVYGQTKPAANLPRSQSAAQTRTKARVAKAAVVLFLVAAFTAANPIVAMVSGLRFEVVVSATALAGQDAQSLLIANGLACAVLVLLGMFAQKGSKLAVILGILLYTGDMVAQLQSTITQSWISTLVHCIVLWQLIQGYRELPA